MQETQEKSLGWEDPRRRAWQPTPVFYPAWRMPWAEDPGGLQPMESQRVGHDLAIKHTQQDTEFILHWVKYHEQCLVHSIVFDLIS